MATATYKFIVPGRYIGQTVTVFDQATNAQVASGAVGSDGAYSVDLTQGDYYARTPDGRYIDGDSSGASNSDVANAAASAGIESAKIQTPSVIVFGDSITNLNTPHAGTLDPSGARGAGSRGYWNWATAYLGRRATLIRDAGIGGNTTAQMLARINTDVLAYDSDWVVFCGGANSITADVTLAQIQSEITQILDKLKGRRVLILTVPPSQNYNTAARQAVLGNLNRWIVDLPLSRRNVVVADVWRVLADPVTGYPATGMAVDAIHPSEAGAQRMGRAIFDALDPLMPRRPNRTFGLTDPSNIIGNPHFGTGTGWTVLGAGVTPTYATADDRWASKATLAITGVADVTERGIQYIEPITNARYAVGDIVQMSARFKWSGASAVTSATGCFRPWLRVYPRLADSSFGSPVYGMFVASAEQVQPVGNQLAAGEMVVATCRLTIPATTANLYVGVGWQGMAAGTVEVSDLAVYKNA